MLHLTNQSTNGSATKKSPWEAVAAIKSLIDEYGATAPHLLLPRMQEVDPTIFPG